MKIEATAILNRRLFLFASALLASRESHSLPLDDAVGKSKLAAPHLLSATEGKYLLGGWRADGENYAGVWSVKHGLQATKLPFRAHQVALLANNSFDAIAIGRRPSRQLARINLKSGSIVAQSTLNARRSLNGHCLIATDSLTLITSENDSLLAHGVLVIRDSTSLTACREISSYGAAPHEMLFDPDGVSIWVANGGVANIPAANSDLPPSTGIASSLVRIHLETGSLMESWELSDPFLSIRHLAISDTGEVGVALQPAHPDHRERKTAPVVAILNRNGKFSTATSSDIFSGYGGDIAWSGSEGGAFAVGCSRANRLGFWGSTGSFLGSTELLGACAVAETEVGIAAVNDIGNIHELSLKDLKQVAHADIHVQWENHAAIIDL